MSKPFTPRPGAVIVGSIQTKNGTYQRIARLQGGPGEYHSIIRSHDAQGNSLENEHGGYNPIATGNPKYISKKWASIIDNDKNISPIVKPIVKEGAIGDRLRGIGAAVRHKVSATIHTPGKKTGNGGEQRTGGALQQRVTTSGKGGKTVNTLVDPETKKTKTTIWRNDANGEPVTQLKEENDKDQPSISKIFLDTADHHMKMGEHHRNNAKLFHPDSPAFQRLLNIADTHEAIASLMHNLSSHYEEQV